MSQLNASISRLRERYQNLSPTQRRNGWITLAALIVLTLLLSRCGGNGDDNAAIEPRPVRLHQVGSNDADAARHFVGRVDAVNTVDLSFQVGGRIIDMPVQQGSFVTKGTLIAALDPSDYQLAVREAELQLEQAARDLERTRTLLERGTLSQSNFDQAETAHNLRKVALDTARRNLAYTRIVAPFDALVTRRLVDPFTNVPAGAHIVRVQNVEEFRVHINVPENLMAALESPQLLVAEAIFSNNPEQPLPLEYREHETEPDAVAQTYRVTFGLARQADKTILPGMTVTVRVRSVINRPDTIYEIPQSALDSNAEGNFRVWVYQPEKSAVVARPVKVLGVTEQGDAMVAGLAGNEQIVSAGVQLLHDDMPVTPFDGF